MPGRQVSSSIVHKMLQSMCVCHALPGQQDSVFVLDHSRRAPGVDAHPSVQLDALMVLEHHHVVSQTMMRQESSCWVLTESVMRACKPTVTLSSPSLFFQPSKPSSFSDWSSLECVVAFEQWGFRIHKLEHHAPCLVPAPNLETLKPKVFVWRKCNALSRQYLLALVVRCGPSRPLLITRKGLLSREC